LAGQSSAFVNPNEVVSIDKNMMEAKIKITKALDLGGFFKNHDLYIIKPSTFKK
jgi:hypothetical protein